MWEKYLAERVLPGFGCLAKMIANVSLMASESSSLAMQNSRISLPKQPSRLAWIPKRPRLVLVLALWCFRVSVVSLVDPGFPSSHSWIPGFRRLTRDSVFQPIFS